MYLIKCCEVPFMFILEVCSGTAYSLLPEQAICNSRVLGAELGKRMQTI